LGWGSAAAPWRVRAQMKSVAALLAWVVFVCAVIGLAGTWLYAPTLGTRAYLWGLCQPLMGTTTCNSYYDFDNFTWTPFTTVLVLQAVSLVLSFIGAIVASVGGCVSQPKGVLVGSIVFQALYFVIQIAAWAYAVSQMGDMLSSVNVKWSYGFALAIVGSVLSLAVMALSAAAIKSAPPPQGAYGAGAPGNPVYGAQQPMAYAQVPGNPVGGQAMQKA
jgi:hypothetical protein